MAARTAGYRTAVRHPVTARLLTAQLVSEVGSFVGLAALLLLAYDASRSAVGPALVLASRSLPAVFVAGVLGRWLDQPPRRTALILTNLAGAAAVSICAVAPGTGTAVVSATLLGATRAAFRSVQMAVIVESVPEEIRLPLFGTAAVINQGSQVVGVLVGATVTLGVGVRTSLLIDVVSFLVAAVVLAGLPSVPRLQRPARPGSLDGVRLVTRHPVLRPLMVLVLVSAFSASLPEAVAPAVAQAAWVPAAMAAAAVGGAIVTLGIARTGLLRRTVNQVRMTVFLATALGSTGVGVMLDAPDWLYVLGNASVGAGLGWVVGAQATTAAVTPRERMGQVEATIVAALVTAGGVGVLALSAVASAAGPAVAYLVAGGLVLVAVAVVGRSLATEPAPA